MLLCMTIYIMEPQQNKSSQKNVTHSGKERPNASVKKDEESECCCRMGYFYLELILCCYSYDFLSGGSTLDSCK